jgi:AcrR family transcriptional regulator
MDDGTSTRAARTAERRQAILEAALRCFIEHGYDATTIDDICAGAGASIGSVYYHFGSKEQMAGALWLDGYRGFGAAVSRTLADSRSVEAAIRDVAVIPLRWARGNEALARFNLDRSSGQVLRSVSAEVQAAAAALCAVVTDWTLPHIKRGTIRPWAAATYVSLWCGPSGDLARRWLHEGPPWQDHLDEAEEAFGEAAWLASRNPRRRRAP